MVIWRYKLDRTFFLISALNSSDASLSNKCVVGFTVPLAVSCFRNARY